MQRVCKYELLLNSIASKERKRNSRLPNPDPVLEDNIKRLLVNAELLNAVLLKIDQKRSEVRFTSSSSLLSSSSPNNNNFILNFIINNNKR